MHFSQEVKHAKTATTCPSLLSEYQVPDVWTIRPRQYHPIRLLQAKTQQTPTLSLQNLWTDLLLNYRNCVSPYPPITQYLHRRSTAHARWPHRLKEHLELLRCHYNFIRPHMALQFGTIRRTPAMQAGLTSRPLTFRQIFSSRVLVVFMIWAWNQSVLTQQRKAA